MRVLDICDEQWRNTISVISARLWRKAQGGNYSCMMPLYSQIEQRLDDKQAEWNDRRIFVALQGHIPGIENEAHHSCSSLDSSLGIKDPDGEFFSRFAIFNFTGCTSDKPTISSLDPTTGKLRFESETAMTVSVTLSPEPAVSGVSVVCEYHVDTKSDGIVHVAAAPFVAGVSNAGVVSGNCDLPTVEELSSAVSKSGIVLIDKVLYISLRAWKEGVEDPSGSACSSTHPEFFFGAKNVHYVEYTYDLQTTGAPTGSPTKGECPKMLRPNISSIEPTHGIIGAEKITVYGEWRTGVQTYCKYYTVDAHGDIKYDSWKEAASHPSEIKCDMSDIVGKASAEILYIVVGILDTATEAIGSKFCWSHMRDESFSDSNITWGRFTVTHTPSPTNTPAPTTNAPTTHAPSTIAPTEAPTILSDTAKVVSDAVPVKHENSSAAKALMGSIAGVFNKTGVSGNKTSNHTSASSGGLVVALISEAVFDAVGALINPPNWSTSGNVTGSNSTSDIAVKDEAVRLALSIVNLGASITEDILTEAKKDANLDDNDEDQIQGTNSTKNEAITNASIASAKALVKSLSVVTSVAEPTVFLDEDTQADYFETVDVVTAITFDGITSSQERVKPVSGDQMNIAETALGLLEIVSSYAANSASAKLSKPSAGDGEMPVEITLMNNRSAESIGNVISTLLLAGIYDAGNEPDGAIEVPPKHGEENGNQPGGQPPLAISLLLVVRLRVAKFRLRGF